MKQLSRVVILLAPLVASTPARAVDGVKLLGQPRTFPITISAPGSYRLKANLTVPDENTTAIVVAADDVSIDLNGFTIQGVTACTGSPHVTSCTPTGTGIGIDSTGRANLTVHNGTVRGMGNAGIVIENGAVDSVKALSNGDTGIRDPGPATTFDTLVTHCTANSNGNLGIDHVGSAIDTTADYNLSAGFFVYGTVSNCTAQQNGSSGITGLGNVTVVNNSTALSNAGFGINAYKVTNSSATFNSGVGILASAATSCTATSNAAPQISALGITGQNL